MEGTYSYAGDTDIEAGTLIVEGSLVHSTVVVHAGGIASGDGTIAALTVDAGAVAPGTFAWPFNPLTVSGDASFGSGTLEIAADPASSNGGQLVIGGTATLGGTVAFDFSGGMPAAGTMYPVLTATAINGTFASVALPPGVFGHLVYNTTSVQLEISAPPDEIFHDGFDAD
jgi:hypothetical protein